MLQESNLEELINIPNLALTLEKQVVVLLQGKMNRTMSSESMKTLTIISEVAPGVMPHRVDLEIPAVMTNS